MRISSQNNQMLINLPSDFISDDINNRIIKYMHNNWIPYLDPISYINSSIKEIIFPGITYEGSEQTIKFGKKVEYKPATNIHDTYNSTLDITFRSIDSHSNYFMMQQIFNEYYNNTKTHYIPDISLHILDKDGDFLYSVVFRSSLLKSLSETRFMYQSMDVSEQTFTVTFKFNFIDIFWNLSDDPYYKPENIFHTKTWDHSNDILPMKRPQNNYNL